MQRWKSANGKEWEEVRSLGSGGQSEVFLVRGPSRVEERRRHLETIKRLSGQGFDDSRAQEFSEAVLGYGREERPPELAALKVYKLHDEEAANNQALERLKVEIDALNEDRPGLLKLLDFNKRERWIATEFHTRGTLEENLLMYTGNALFSLTAFRYLVQTAATLHKDGIFHRDIKPANVFLSSDGSLTLGDFGIAMPPDLPARLTFTNESVGPWDYRPPWAEMVGRVKNVDGSFDVYMLGKLLWCMVAGRLRLPREWYAEPEYDLTVKFPNDPRMHMINDILKKCLHDRPEKCLPSAGELLLVVDAHLGAMRQGGQMLREGVPRPCRVCGIGFYEAGPPAPTRILAVHKGSAQGPGQGNHANTWRQEGALYAEFFTCNKCGHVQLFKVE